MRKIEKFGIEKMRKWETQKIKKWKQDEMRKQKKKQNWEMRKCENEKIKGKTFKHFIIICLELCTHIFGISFLAIICCIKYNGFSFDGFVQFCRKI